MKDLYNCPNCGAPIDDDRCAYCGTVFLDICDVEPGKLVYLKFRPNPKIKAYARARVVTLQFDPYVVGYEDITLSLRGEQDKQGRMIVFERDLK